MHAMLAVQPVPIEKDQVNLTLLSGARGHSKEPLDRRPGPAFRPWLQLPQVNDPTLPLLRLPAR